MKRVLLMLTSVIALSGGAIGSDAAASAANGPHPGARLSSLQRAALAGALPGHPAA
jgi:hypothetical protein